MGKEIERKFLIHAEKWQAVEKPRGKELRQGYIVSDPSKTVRVRVSNNKGFITIKGISVGAVRSEFEYEIPKNEAIELLEQFTSNEIRKTRYEVFFDGKTWEVDEFEGANEGLIVAELELNDENEAFAKPEWIAQEVTEDTRYFNSNLSLHPFSKW